METPATPNPTAAVYSAYPDPVPAYEIRSELYDRFHDFDDREVYDEYLVNTIDEKTANFAVRFGADHARIATNLREQDVAALLDLDLGKREEENLPVTWINIWSAAQNRDIVSRIAKRYKFSSRLGGSILAWDKARKEIAQHASRKNVKAEDHLKPKLRRTFHRTQDLEKGPANGQAERPTTSQGVDPFSEPFDPEDLKMYGLLQKTYNYTTIDHGSGCEFRHNFCAKEPKLTRSVVICIGANWLHERASSGNPEESEHQLYEGSAELVPPKHWAWYILTSDCTVISIHEAPHFDSSKGDDADALRRRSEELRNMRKNTHDLLSQLSKIGIRKYEYRVASQKGVRSDLAKTTSRHPASRTRTTVMESSEAVDASANLFYYLFEDYTAPTSFLSNSSVTLSKLDWRNKDKDTSDIIKTLYARSRDLRQLKHLFESYEKLIKGIMDLPVDYNDREESMAGSNPNLLWTISRGVRLSQKAVDRFGRLNDRLRLLMLDTIDEYLVEKSSLSDTYFNLLAQKDSQATAKLNRSASLLAKLSVFFLPISFMTSYFSVQIPDLTNGYTGTTYWVTFAVIATLSFLSLFFFSRMLMIVSDVLDEKVHQIQKKSWRTIKQGLNKKGQKGKGKDAGNDDKSRDSD
ncbi:hypothetical protein VP1G_04493 [Cytospora mali]|uniref:ADP-ribosylation factor n=1 Tax=Cytospora mali TaxID=578113 RepID=A0A194V004_CYTMA|nr:hypothetical protein VP1G_04493 [Valsa mali var. pyri (nom. inval.)]